MIEDSFTILEDRRRNGGLQEECIHLRKINLEEHAVENFSSIDIIRLNVLWQIIIIIIIIIIICPVTPGKQKLDRKEI